jgi:predicted 3-demethylubiquinone-9 3-methyltransferase (glyoxalase superfamily)
MQNITPFLWFDTQAEQAMRFYASIFPRFKEIAVRRAQGAVMSVEFEVNGQRVIGLNGGPMYKFTEAFSFFVPCDTQAEIDDLWTQLTADGGAPGRCGWLKDKFGLSWQVVPAVLTELLGGSDPVRSGRAVQAMLTMNKLDIATLQRAYDSDPKS